MIFSIFENFKLIVISKIMDIKVVYLNESALRSLVDSITSKEHGMRIIASK